MNVSLNKRLLGVLLISILFLSILFPLRECSGQVYIHPQIRCENYDSYPNQHGYSYGSCVHASTITNLHYLGYHDLANWIPNHYSGPHTHFTLNKSLNRWGLKTRATFSSSKEILDFAHSNHLPAVISYHHNHSCLFLGWYVDPRSGFITHAYVLNPNDPSRPETPTYTSFMNNWRRNDGEAVVIVPSVFRRVR